MRTWKAILVAALSAVMLLSAGAVSAADVTREERVAKLPETPADQEAMAKDYETRAADWRAEAAYHTKMAELYKASHANKKDAQTMAQHCSKIAKDADEAAKQAQMMADYYRLQAKETKGAK